LVFLETKRRKGKKKREGRAYSSEHNENHRKSPRTKFLSKPSLYKTQENDGDFRKLFFFLTKSLKNSKFLFRNTKKSMNETQRSRMLPTVSFLPFSQEPNKIE
jgi:hypothetical protein